MKTTQKFISLLSSCSKEILSYVEKVFYKGLSLFFIAKKMVLKNNNFEMIDYLSIFHIVLKNAPTFVFKQG